MLARSEFDPAGEATPRAVEEVFVRFGAVWRLEVGGRDVFTTPEHPFFEAAKGWVPCQELAVGDRLLCRDGSWVAFGAVEDTGRWETVYNFRIAEDHTYFVGCPEWGFGVWAHNVKYGTSLEEIRKAAGHSQHQQLIWSVQRASAATELYRRTVAAGGNGPEAVIAYATKHGVAPENAPAVARATEQLIAIQNARRSQGEKTLARLIAEVHGIEERRTSKTISSEEYLEGKARRVLDPLDRTLQGRQERGENLLYQDLFDTTLPAYMRGEIARERLLITERGELPSSGARRSRVDPATGEISPRTPDGRVQQHGYYARASEGFDYTNSVLGDRMINMLEEVGRARLHSYASQALHDVRAAFKRGGIEDPEVQQFISRVLPDVECYHNKPY